MGRAISRAARMGTLAGQVINSSKGELCGVFSSSIAIRYGDFAVSVTENQSGQPFAINVDSLPAVGTENLIGEEICRYGKGLRNKRGSWFIDLSGAELWDARNALERLPAATQNTALAFDKVLRLLLLQDRSHRGLAALAPQVWRSAKKSALDEIKLCYYRRLMSIKEGLNRQDPGQVMESAGGIIGLGVGLTPSGDDFLTGLLLVLQIAECGRREHRRFVRQLLRGIGRFPRRTNIFGWSYLYGACRGYGAEVVLAAIHELFERGPSNPKLQKLASIGATSGLDTLVGITMGLDHLAHHAAGGAGSLPAAEMSRMQHESV